MEFFHIWSVGQQNRINRCVVNFLKKFFRNEDFGYIFFWKKISKNGFNFQEFLL